jgi:hypothetical protein
VKGTGNEVVLSADSWDPVLAIGRSLADRYGITLSIEAPRWAFPGDTEDVATADPAFSKQHGNVHYAVMNRHHLQVQFSLGNTGRPTDIPSLVHQIADAANKELPYAYRVDIDGQDYVLVPTRTRNSAGELQEVQPLLDRHVTIPAGTRTIAEHAKLMADQLSQQTGLNVSCCQAFVFGVPWGRASVAFAADNKPAREVLRSLIRIEKQANSEASNMHPEFDHWTVSCDGTGAPWCFIEVEGKFSSRCPWATHPGLHPEQMGLQPGHTYLIGLGYHAIGNFYTGASQTGELWD